MGGYMQGQVQVESGLMGRIYHWEQGFYALRIPSMPCRQIEPIERV